MAFKVKLFHNAPDFEALQVAKLDYYIPDHASYRPFSQAHVCFSPQGLHVQLLSFETFSPPESLIQATLCFPGQRGGVFTLQLFADGRYDVQFAATGAAESVSVAETALHPITGEDLQGVFWGGLFTLPLDRYVDFAPKPDAVFTGNFYKLCDDPARAHRCSFYPADFKKPLSAPENLGDFTIIDY